MPPVLAWEPTVRGQIIHLNRDSHPDRNQEASMVTTQPPMKPSQVFLGDRSISLRYPTKTPAHASKHRLVSGRLGRLPDNASQRLSKSLICGGVLWEADPGGLQPELARRSQS